MAGRTDLESLRELPQKELAEIYCEALAYEMMPRASKAQTEGSAT
jgi:hypothetical protein